MRWVCVCVHVYVRGVHGLEDLLGVGFRPCTRAQRASAAAFVHPRIITHVRGHKLNDTRCNVCVRACTWHRRVLCSHYNFLGVRFCSSGCLWSAHTSALLHISCGVGPLPTLGVRDCVYACTLSVQTLIAHTVILPTFSPLTKGRDILYHYSRPHMHV